MKIKTVRPEYVPHLPEVLSEGILYICEEFDLAAHKCCCGCGEEVITPLNEAQWRVIKNGSRVSLWPSVGNWKYACRSHYWITESRIVDAPPMTNSEIIALKQRDRRDKDVYIQLLNEGNSADSTKSWLKLIAQRGFSLLKALWRRLVPR